MFVLCVSLSEVAVGQLLPLVFAADVVYQMIVTIADSGDDEHLSFDSLGELECCQVILIGFSACFVELELLRACGFEHAVHVQQHLAILENRIVLLEVRLPFELNDAEIDVDLVVADEGVFLREVFLCKVNAVEFDFPTA